MGNRPDAWVRQLPGLDQESLLEELTRPVKVISAGVSRERPLIPTPEQTRKILSSIRGRKLGDFKQAILKAVEAVYAIKEGAENKGGDRVLTVDNVHGVRVSDGGIETENLPIICTALSVGGLGGGHGAHWYLQRYSSNNEARVISSGWTAGWGSLFDR